jgi:hypothetical protein
MYIPLLSKIGTKMFHLHSLDILFNSNIRLSKLVNQTSVMFKRLFHVSMRILSGPSLASIYLFKVDFGSEVWNRAASFHF